MLYMIFGQPVCELQVCRSPHPKLANLLLVLLRYLNVFYAAFRDLAEIDPFFLRIIQLLGMMHCNLGQNDEGYFIMQKHLGDLGCGIFLLSQV